MLHIKMFIGNAIQEIIQTNQNGEFAGDVLIKLPWIPVAPCITCVQYCGEAGAVPWGLSVSGGYQDACGGHLEYRGGYSVPWGIS